jgi:hypothetical protein
MKPFVRRISVAAVLLSLAACKVADVGPFVDASVQVRSGIAGTGDAVRLELESMEAPTTKDGPSAKFAEIWKVRVQAADAMVQYASSLKSIADAAAAGEASGEKLASSVQALGEAAGIFPGGRLAANVGADVIKLIVGQIAQVRGYSSLKESLTSADSAVQGIAGLLRQDLADADAIVRLAVQAQLNAQTAEFGDHLGFRLSLLKQQKDIYAATATPEKEARLSELDKQLHNADTWYLPYAKTQDDLKARLRLERQLLAKCGQAIDEWGQAHHRLTLAVREGSGFSVESLLATAGEIRDLVKRVQSHE